MDAISDDGKSAIIFDQKTSAVVRRIHLARNDRPTLDECANIRDQISELKAPYAATCLAFKTLLEDLEYREHVSGDDWIQFFDEAERLIKQREASKSNSLADRTARKWELFVGICTYWSEPYAKHILPKHEDRGDKCLMNARAIAQKWTWEELVRYANHLKLIRHRAALNHALGLQKQHVKPLDSSSVELLSSEWEVLEKFAKSEQARPQFLGKTLTMDILTDAGTDWSDWYTGLVSLPDGRLKDLLPNNWRFWLIIIDEHGLIRRRSRDEAEACAHTDQEPLKNPTDGAAAATGAAAPTPDLFVAYEDSQIDELTGLLTPELSADCPGEVALLYPPSSTLTNSNIEGWENTDDTDDTDDTEGTDDTDDSSDTGTDFNCSYDSIDEGVTLTAPSDVDDTTSEWSKQRLGTRANLKGGYTPRRRRHDVSWHGASVTTTGGQRKGTRCPRLATAVTPQTEVSDVFGESVADRRFPARAPDLQSLVSLNPMHCAFVVDLLCQQTDPDGRPVGHMFNDMSPPEIHCYFEHIESDAICARWFGSWVRFALPGDDVEIAHDMPIAGVQDHGHGNPALIALDRYPTIDVQNILLRLQTSFPDLNVDIVSTSGPPWQTIRVKDFVKAVNAGEPLSANNLGRTLDPPSSLSTSHSHFTFFETLMERTENEPGKQISGHASSVRACLSVAGLSGPRSFTGPQVESLCSTELHVLDGMLFIAWVSRDNMTPRDWGRFNANEFAWEPISGVRKTCLRRGHVFRIAPRTVYSTYACSPSLFTRTVFQVRDNVVPELVACRRAGLGWRSGNEEVTRRLPKITRLLEDMVLQDGCNATNRQTEDAIAMLKSFRRSVGGLLNVRTMDDACYDREFVHHRKRARRV